MNANDPNIALLEIVAERLGDELALVGRAVAGLLITDPAMPAIRPTDDVAMICQALETAQPIGLFEHVFESYPERNAGVYANMGVGHTWRI